MKDETINYKEIILELKEEVKALKVDRKNKKLSIYGSILTPIFVALLGGYFAINQANIRGEIEELNNKWQAEIEEQNRLIDQANLSKDFLNALSGTDLLKTEMALQIIAHTNTKLSLDLAKILSKSKDSNAQDIGLKLELDFTSKLIRELIHTEKDVRWNAAEGLLSYADNPDLISSLIDFALKDPEANKKEGGEKWRIYNVMTVILDLSRGNKIKSQKEIDEVKAFISWAEQNDNRTQRMVAEIREKLN